MTSAIGWTTCAGTTRGHTSAKRRSMGRLCWNSRTTTCRTWLASPMGSTDPRSLAMQEFSSCGDQDSLIKIRADGTAAMACRMGQCILHLRASHQPNHGQVQCRHPCRRALTALPASRGPCARIAAVEVTMIALGFLRRAASPGISTATRSTLQGFLRTSDLTHRPILFRVPSRHRRESTTLLALGPDPALTTRKLSSSTSHCRLG